MFDKAKEIGLLSEEKLNELENAKKEMDKEIERLKGITVYPTKETNEKLFLLGKEYAEKNNEEFVKTGANNPVSAFEFLARKEINYDNLSEFVETVELDPLAKEQVEIEAKYRVFI